MIFQTNLYQNGDIEIIRKEEEWQDDSCKDYEVLLFTNYFDEIKDHDNYGKIDLYKKYKDVVIRYDSIRRYAGKSSLSNKDVRGQIVLQQDFLVFDFRNLTSSTSLVNLERKELEENLDKITKKLQDEAKDLKQAIQKELNEIHI